MTRRASPQALLRLWPRVRPYRIGLIIASITLILASAISLAFPLAVRYLLDAAFLHHDRALLEHVRITRTLRLDAGRLVADEAT